jgi:hypothetical protein
MKNALLSFAFLSMALLCHAQKSTKNEFSIGYFSAGEYFDSSAFKLTDFNKGKHISLNYTRLFGKNFSVGLSYSRCVFYYIPTPYPDLFEDNTILWREQKTFAANLGIGVSKWSISAKAKAGIRYNIVGYKAEHYFYFGGGGPLAIRRQSQHACHRRIVSFACASSCVGDFVWSVGARVANTSRRL